MVTIVLESRIGRGGPETFGPFRQVEIGHRRLLGDGEQLALRGGVTVLGAPLTTRDTYRRE